MELKSNFDKAVAVGFFIAPFAAVAVLAANIDNMRKYATHIIQDAHYDMVQWSRQVHSPENYTRNDP